MDDRCSACSGKYCPIPPDGPKNARVMAVGERPGQTEELNAREGFRRFGPLRCFVGQAGDEFNLNYLKLAGLDREEIRTCNTVRCGSDLNRKPGMKEIQACSQHFLKADLESTNPEIVLLLGATACSLVEGGVDLEVEHGIPRRGKIFDWEGWVVAMYHPALGLHSTGKMTEMLADWEHLGEWLEKKDIPSTIGQALRPSVDYKIVRTWGDWMTYLLNNKGPIRFMAVDTESHAGEPFSIQISVRPHTGRMFLFEDMELVKALGSFLRNASKGHSMNTGHPWRGNFIFHHAPADIPLLEGLGVDVEGRYFDTMAMAYHLGNQPQGLKALGYRLLGVRMKSWEDLVTPYSRDKIMDYLIEAILLAEGRRVYSPQFSEKTGKRLKNDLVDKLPEERVLRDLLRYVQRNEAYNPWKRLAGELEEEDIEEGEDWTRYEKLSVWLKRELGMWPERGIGHVPLEEAKEYGCRDSDVTLQVYFKLLELRDQAIEKWNVQPYDYDQPATQSLQIT